MSWDKITLFSGYRWVMLVLGLGPGLKDSLRTGDKSLVLSLALRLSPWNSLWNQMVTGEHCLAMLTVYKTSFSDSTVYKLQNINIPDFNEATVTTQTAATSKQHHLLHSLFQRLLCFQQLLFYYGWAHFSGVESCAHCPHITKMNDSKLWTLV